MNIERTETLKAHIRAGYVPPEVGRNSLIMKPFYVCGIKGEVEQWLQEKHQVAIAKDYLFFPNRSSLTHLGTLAELVCILEQT